jgi:phosphatidylinositol alpha-1,6-mannosyltransferase
LCALTGSEHALVGQASSPMNSSIPHILLGAYSLQAGVGGIARVARLMARVLIEEQRAGALMVRGLTLGDAEVPADLDLPVALAWKSKVRFSLKALGAALGCRHFIYDGCHLSQVHFLPLLRWKPFLTFIHGIEVWEKGKPGYVKSARRATMLLANSEYTRERTNRLHGGFARARVCWLATESDDLPSAPRDLEQVPSEVLIVGRLEVERYKGHRELIACWPRVTAAVPDAVLRIVGQGPDLKPLQELAARSPAAGRIVFEGFVSDKALEQLYARAAVFAMPSRGEGFGLVYIEAMRHGLPVIASVHDAAPEVVLEGKTGYNVNLDRPDELPEGLIHVLKDADHARQLGLNGQKRWAEHFRYSAFRDRFRPLLYEFLGCPEPRPPQVGHPANREERCPERQVLR